MNCNIKLIALFFLFTILVVSPKKVLVSNKYINSFSSSSDSNTAIIPKNIDTNNIFSVNQNTLKSGLLYNIDKNEIVWSRKIDRKLSIASLTKMMVALIVVENIKSGKINWTDKVKVPNQAVSVGGSRVFLKAGSIHTVEELLNSAIIASGNDACYSLASFCEGSEKKFVDRMNLRAKEIQMNSTYFYNSTGMPGYKSKDNVSTSYDLLLLSKEIIKHTEIISISKKSSEKIKNGYKTINIHNHNRLVNQYSEISGIKTGWTNRARYCIVVYSQKDSTNLVCVILGSPSSKIRNSLVVSLINQYHQKLSVNKLGSNY